jgi:glycosyltransferase involved in cell wall biosynthesis
LQNHGIATVVQPLFGDDYVRDLYSSGPRKPTLIMRSYLRRAAQLATSYGYDLIWIEKEVLPWLPGWYELLTARLGLPYVVDYDDPIFHRYDHHRNPLVRLILGRKIDAVMRRASAVIAGSRYLADFARRARAAHVVELPSVVDLTRYHVVPRRPDGTFRIGWIGTPLTAQYLHVVRPALLELAQRRRVVVVAVGAGGLDLGPVPTEVRSWSEVNEVTDIQTFDVGIMPLPDTPMTRGKCGYKLIQYMACGRPVVASPIGANSDIVDHGTDGFLASSTADWIRLLDVFAQRPALAEEMGRAARRTVESTFSLQVIAPKLAAVLENAATKHRRHAAFGKSETDTAVRAIGK